MTEPQPEFRWAPREAQPKRRGRIWLIVALVVVVIAIVALVLFFLIPRGDAAGPADPTTPSPSPSASVSETPSPTTSPAPPSPQPVATDEPEPSPPPVPDPDVETFAGQVGPRLDDAERGFSLLEGMSGPEAVQVVDQLQQDGQRLMDAAAPSSISDEWHTAVAEYAADLNDLRSAYEGGTDPTRPSDEAQNSLQTLRDLVHI